MTTDTTNRMKLGVIAAVVCVALVPLWWLIARPSADVPPTDIEVHDTAFVLDAKSMERSVRDVDFWKPVHVAVVTAGDLHGESLNNWVLEYARSMDGQPWISKEHTDKWADGLFIMAVAPSDRVVGTYFGEDIKVDLDTQGEIQDAAKDAFRSGDWSGGLLDGIEAAASRMGKPALRNVADLATSVLGVGGAGWLAVVGARRKEAGALIKEAETAYANVTRDFDQTQVTAGTIPADDPHGAEVLARLDTFTSDYHALTRRFMDFGKPSGLSLFSTGVRDEAKELAEKATVLDATDDSIVHAAEFLNMSSKWREAWENELGPIREDLGALEELLSKNAKDIDPADHSGATDSIRKATLRIDQMTQELASGSLSPSAALDELDQMDQGAHQWADRIIGTLVAAGDDEDERKRRREEWDDTDWDDYSTYSGSWTLGGRSGSYESQSTIRTTPGMPGYSQSIDSRTVPVSGLVVGYTAASSAASSAGSGGSDSSYSGGGGGFSGSGSSSSF